MLYQWYEMGHVAVRPARAAANSYRYMLQNPFNPITHTAVGRQMAAGLEVFERTTRHYAKPVFGIDSVRIGGTRIAVEQEVVWQRPFCRVIRFKRELAPEIADAQPKLLLFAPMSGHFVTLLRGTVEAFLPDHDVYITDWQNAHDVPLSAGRFDLDDYIDYVREMLAYFKGNVHVFSVCQPSVPVIAAIAMMEEDDDPNVPLTLALAGGPIDTRVSPTVVNRLAEEKGTDWFRRNVITAVPWPNQGFGRMVYPGFLQLTGFMTMNLDRHLEAHKDLFLHLVHGDGNSAEKHREFYDEYLAVMDLTAEFYLQTVDTVFVRHKLPRGRMMHRGRRIDLGAIKRVALLTIEGEKDDITGTGQCRAAQRLCTGIPDTRKMHYECPGVGHYGVFNGSRFRREIATRIAAFARQHDPLADTYVPVTGLEMVRGLGKLAAPAKELASLAFTFAAATEVGSQRQPERSVPRKPAMVADGGADRVGFAQIGHGHNLVANTMPLRMWGLFGALMLDGMMVLNGGRGTFGT